MKDQDVPLARLIDRIHEAHSQRTPLEIRGGGTKSFYGEPPRGAPLNVTEISGISSYEPTELVVTARAGTLLSDLESTLDEQGQYLPFEPPHFTRGATVGGMVAAGLSGPARVSAGSVRDHVLGVTLVDGRGEVLNFGGQVTKNVAGYDVSRLMVGSLGILGVICEVSLKVMPTGTATSTLLFECDETSALAQFGRWRCMPLPINASSWHEGRLHVRLVGARAAVREATETLGGMPVAPDAAQTWWSSVRNQTADFFRLTEQSLARGECLWRLSVPATSAPLQVSGRQFVEWNGAQRWCRTTAAGGELREAAARVGGHATLVRGIDKSVGVFTPLSEVLMGIHRGLKHAFDPERLFNPGRLYREL